MKRPLQLLAALTLLGASALSAMALPNANALQPPAGYANVSTNGDPLNITVTATKPGFGVFWVAIASSGAALTPKSNSVGWATSPDKDGAVWRTNTGAKGGMLIPVGQAGYSGFPHSGNFVAQVKGNGSPTDVKYIIHVINLATGNTFWTTPGGNPPPPPPSCAGILIFGPDPYLTTDLAAYVNGRDPSLNVTVHQTSNTTYTAGEFTTAINDFKAAHQGAPPCSVMLDPEYVGPGNLRYGGLDAQDQQTLKNLILSGAGLVYAEPYTLIGDPAGQLASVLPVAEVWSTNPTDRYAVIDPANPVTSGLTGLSPDPVLTGLNSWVADSSGQVDSLNLLPVAGVTYAGQTPILRTSPTGSINSYTLLYQPTSANPAQPGGRVAVLGTDTYPGNNSSGTVAPTTLELYYNALRWTAGL